MKIKVLKIKTTVLLFFIFVLFTIYSKGIKAQSRVQKGLKDYYKEYFPIGVAVSPQSVKNKETADFILSQFNSLTPE
ncbi:MAG: 1,4-beta-xylanase, partial [Mucilaginibacter sp.]|nr:1,4-beta-xylanase [Mucilaginibacter sp.]